MNEPESGRDGLAPSMASQLWYRTCYLAASAGSVLGLSYRHEGVANVPSSGPVLVLANHQSFLDPPLVGLAVRRPLIYLARKTLFRNAVFRWLIRSLNAVPIDQDGVGKEGMRTISDQLRMGKAVLVFPEGTRTPDGKMHALKPGIHLLMRRSRVQILPVGIAGAFQAWPVSRRLPRLAPLFLPAGDATCAVSIGKPFDSAPLAEMRREEALKVLFDRIAAVQSRAEALRRR